MQVLFAARRRISRSLTTCCVSAALAAIVSSGCSRSPAGSSLDAGKSQQPEGSAPSMEPCTTHDKLAASPCRNGERNVDAIGAASIELSHCPLDDCGSGGCTYDVYGAHQGCLRKLGSVHGASIDVAVADASAGASIRTWGRSGTTHVATEYDVQGGTLRRRRQFVCDYASGKPLAAECPKL